jgi:hypothetical protein
MSTQGEGYDSITNQQGQIQGQRSILDGQPYEACNEVLGEQCCEGMDEGCQSAGEGWQAVFLVHLLVQVNTPLL